VTRSGPLVGFVRKESFVRSLVTAQSRYRTRMQRYSVRMYVAFLALIVTSLRRTIMLLLEEQRRTAAPT
jgi:hypothetical protein